MMKVAGAGHAGRQVAAQGDQSCATAVAVGIEQLAQLATRATDAGDVRGGVQVVLLTQRRDGFRGVAKGRAARAEGDRHIIRLVLSQTRSGAVQLLALGVGFGWVELETDARHCGALGNGA